MIARIVLIVALGGLMWAARSVLSEEGASSHSGLTLALGFVLLTAFLVGQLASKIGLPKLTGYLATGIAAGPHGLDLVTERMVSG
ncbi:MAG TPA: hypothetical protein VIL20_09955, partial [Sandaracinaceae bacterium]